MKRMLSLCMVCFLLLGAMFSLPVHAGIIGEVITTDIVTYIDEQPIESYNINDYTYVIAEELQEYGFAVYWRSEERKLEIFEMGGAIPRSYPSADLINVRKDANVKGQHAFDVYETDIVTTLNGEVVNAYNVDGQTLIQVDELARFAHFSYNDARREVKIAKAAWYADWLFEQSAKEDLALPCEREDGVILYTGDVVDGKPNGLGRIVEIYENRGEGLQYLENVITTGKFVDGEIYEPVVTYTNGVRVPYNGTDQRKRQSYSFRAGEGNGNMRYSVTYYDDGSKARVEEKVSGDKVIYRRETVYDPAYRFGYRVVQEGPVNPLGSYADYSETAAGKIVSVEADSFTGLIVDEKGTLFATGYTEQGGSPVPVKLSENVSSAATENLYLGTDGVLYNGGEAIAENVVWMSERVYVKENGELYQMNGTLIDNGVSQASAENGLVLYIKNGDAYYLRLNFEEEGSKWNDALDLSKPVKVFEGAKYVSRGNRFLVVDEGGTLWGWSSYWYGTPYQDKEGNLFSCKTPIKLAENVAFADSGTGFIAYRTNDGTLYVMPDATEPKNAAIFDITEPVQLLSHVAQISAGGSYMLIVDENGQLYSWGENKEGRLGTGSLDAAKVPQTVTAFYEK